MIKAINRSIAARHEEDEKGFTLIELLVVILIIGVLAAIAIPAFLNQREAAWVSQVESDLRNATIAAESYAVAHNGSYASMLDTDTATADDDELVDFGFNPTDSVTLWISGTPDTGFVLAANHDSIDDQTWTYDSATGVIEEIAYLADGTDVP